MSKRNTKAKSSLAKATINRRVWQTLLPRERAGYVTLVSAKALAGLLDLFGIVLIGLLAALAAARAQGGKPPVIFGVQMPSLTDSELVWLVVAILVIFLGKAILATILSWRVSRLIARIEVRNARVVARQFLFSGLQNSATQTKGDTQWALTGSISAAYTGILNRLSIVISETTLLGLIVCSFLLVNVVATVFMMLYFAVLVVGLQWSLSRTLRRAGQDLAQGTVETSSVVSDTAGAYREITVARVQTHFIERIVSARAKLSTSGARVAFLVGMPRYLVETALILGVVIFTIWQFSLGQLEAGMVTVGVFLTGGVRIMASLLPLQNSWSTMRSEAQQADLALGIIESAKRTAEVRSARVTTTDLGAPLDREGAHVVLSDVAFSYDGDAFISDLSLELGPGTRTAIIGPSGAGKSTIADLVLGLLTPAQGSVRVDGFSPEVLEEKFPGAIGYVPQRPGIVSGTIAENIALGHTLEEIDFTRIDDLISSCHLGEFVSALPEGVHTVIGDGGSGLSGGQIQRLGLARALYVRPRLLVLDEATSALDAKSESLVTTTLDGISGVTVLVIAHRLSTVQNADIVHVLERGVVTHSGEFSSLKQNVPLVAEYVDLMSVNE